MRDWELIFGNKLPTAVREIQMRAFQKNTIQAYNDAIQQIKGINYLLLCMGFRDDIVIRMGNEERKLERLRDAISNVRL